MRINTVSRTFRLTPALDADLAELAKAVPRNPSQLCREAVSQFVRFYKTNPKELQS